MLLALHTSRWANEPTNRGHLLGRAGMVDPGEPLSASKFKNSNRAVLLPI